MPPEDFAAAIIYAVSDRHDPRLLIDDERAARCAVAAAQHDYARLRRRAQQRGAMMRATRL